MDSNLKTVKFDCNCTNREISIFRRNLVKDTFGVDIKKALIYVNYQACFYVKC